MIVSVTAPRSWLLREPSKSSAQETELLFGHQFRIDKTEKKWVYGQALSPLHKDGGGQEVAGYTGWMKRKDLVETFAPPTHYVSVLKAPVFKSADIKSRVKRSLPMGAQFHAASIDNKFYELHSGGFVHSQHVQLLGNYPETDFVNTAELHMGLPYIWGGVSSDGLDCSGLVQSSLRAAGTDCLRDAGQQEESLGTALGDKTPLQRGDLVFWPGHVGVMSDYKTLLHANAFHMSVAKEPFVIAVARIGEPRQIKRL